MRFQRDEDTLEVNTSKSKAKLEAENIDLRDENQELQDQLDTIADIVSPADEDHDEDEAGDGDGEEEDNN